MARTARNGVGGDARHETFGRQMSHPVEKTSAYICHTYAMIACRAERPGWLRRDSGHNCQKTPQISYF
jgi:hypothetical protein